MFVRIVKLSFQDDKIQDFKDYFETIKHIVRNQPGCEFLEVYQDKDQPSTFFTYSYWLTPEHLEQYRYSQDFATIWPFVKTLFKERAQAWSVDKIQTLK